MQVTSISPPGGPAAERAERQAAFIAKWHETAQPAERRALDLYLSGKVRLPAIPKVAAKLVPLLSRNNADVAECVKLIEVDRVLATAMLKCANSVAFFRGIATTNVRDAVMRIGLKGSAALALSLSTTALYDQRVKKALEFIGSNYESEWRRSVLVAHAARAISAHFKQGDQELAFTGGLFGNVGDSLAAFVLANLAVKDQEVAAMSMQERLELVGRLRAVLMREYIIRESLPESLGDLCVEVEEPIDVVVKPTSYVLRLTFGLTVDRDLEPTVRATYLKRGLAAAKSLGMNKEALDQVKNLVIEAGEQVDAFAVQLKSR